MTGTSQTPRLLAATVHEALAMARAGWWMLLAAALVLAILFRPDMAQPAGAVIAGLSAILLAGGLLSQRQSGGPVRAGDLMRVTLASLLALLVLGFFLILAGMAGGLVVFAVMAGTGFDFEAASETPGAFDAAFAAFLTTPVGRASQAAFLFAIALWLLAIARMLPFAAASVAEGRVIVLEAFNRSRGRALALSGALLVAAGPGLALIIAGARIAPTGGALWSGIAALGIVLAVLGAAAVSSAAAGGAQPKRF